MTDIKGMAYPVNAVTRPACLSGQANGRLTSNILLATDVVGVSWDCVLVTPATRAWRALWDAAKKAGHTLKPSGPGSSYRTYAEQESIFRARYVNYDTGNEKRYWIGKWWWRRDGVAAAAVPGTSNHGWGLAVDTGEERDGDSGTESIDSGTLNWLIANEQRFGFSHEIQSEPWHIRYFAGDNIPQAVLDYEGSSPLPPQSQDDDDMKLILRGDATPQWWLTDGLIKDYIEHVDRAAELVFAGLAKWNNGGPFVVPQAMVDNIPRIEDVVRKVLNEGTGHGQTSWAATNVAILSTVQDHTNKLNSIDAQVS